MSKPTHSRLCSFGVLPALLLGLGCFVSPVAAAPDALSTRAVRLAQSRGANGAQLAYKRGKLAKQGGDAVSLKLAAKRCLVAATIVDDAVPDVVLTLEVKDGPTLSDDGSGPSAALRYCAGAVDEKVTLRARSETATAFVLGAWGISSEAAAAGQADAGVEGAQPAPLASLGKRLQQLAAKRASGLSAMTPVREEDVASQEARKREVVLAADQCYRVLVVAEPAEVEIEVALSDAQGASQGNVRGKLELSLPDAKPFCAKTSGPYNVSVRTTGGAGRVAWQLYGASNPELEARWPVGGKGDQLVNTRMRDIHRNQAAKAPVMEFESGQLATNDVHTSHFDVVGGRCYLAVAAGVPSLRALEIEIIDQRGNTIARGQEQNSINMQRVCADISGSWTMNAKAFKGYGAFGVQVFVAPQQ